MDTNGPGIQALWDLIGAHSSAAAEQQVMSLLTLHLPVSKRGVGAYRRVPCSFTALHRL